MLRVGNTLSSFIAACAAAGLIVWAADRQGDIRRVASEAGATAGRAVASPANAAPGEAKSPNAGPWAASAPGRVEPISGEVRVASQVPGKIVEVLVGVNDQVKAGDLLVRLDDEDQRARVDGADSEVQVRTRERDQENVAKNAKDRRTAEDNLDRAQRNLFATRFELDRVMTSRRSGRATDADVTTAREAVASARTLVERERDNLQRVIAAGGLPLPTRLESGLAVARAELTVAETALGRTRIRAPIDGTILQVNARTGELVAPSVEAPLIVIGDLSRLRVRAEIVERDIDKVRIGQGAVVTSDAFPGRQFDAKVTQVARSLSAPVVAQKGPRRPNEVDVLEVIVELSGQTPLIPGMRTDVFFKPDQATAGTGTGTGAASGATETKASAAAGDPKTGKQ